MNLSSPRSKPPPLSVRPPSSSRSWTCLSLSSTSGRTDTARSASSSSRPSTKWPAIKRTMHGRPCRPTTYGRLCPPTTYGRFSPPEWPFCSSRVRSFLLRCPDDDDERTSGPFLDIQKETIDCCTSFYFFFIHSSVVFFTL